MEQGTEFIYVFWQYAYGLFKTLISIGEVITTPIGDWIEQYPWLEVLLPGLAFIGETPLGDYSFATLFIGAGLIFIILFRLVKFFTDLVL